MHRSSRGHNIINLHNHADTLGGQCERARGHEQRLQYVLLQHVGDAALLHVDPRILLASRVESAQLRHHLDRVEACVLRQRIGHDLKCLGKCSDTVAVHALQRFGPLRELIEDLCLGR